MQSNNRSEKMSNAQHTPGPWTYYEDLADHYKHKVRGVPGLICAMPGWLAHEHLRLEQEANARLLASAPELLAALESAMPMLKGHQETPEKKARYAAAVAAIAKAKGQA
jgi:hypothetical protein